jgi:hypothetical protein
MIDVGNNFIGYAHSFVDRRAPHVGAQPELGVLSERWCGSVNPDCDAFAGENLNGAARAI